MIKFCFSHGSQTGNQEDKYILHIFLFWPFQRGLISVFKSNMRRESLCLFTSGVVLPLTNSHLSVNCQGWGGERSPACMSLLPLVRGLHCLLTGHNILLTNRRTTSAHSGRTAMPCKLNGHAMSRQQVSSHWDKDPNVCQQQDHNLHLKPSKVCKSSLHNGSRGFRTSKSAGSTAEPRPGLGLP